MVKEAKIVEVNGVKWIACPYCNKRLLKLDEKTRIENLPYRCKGSNCKQTMIVNYESQ